MLGTRRLAPLLVATMLLTLALGAPAATRAADGEVIQVGSNVAGDVTLSGGRPRFVFGNVGNCPGTPPPGASCFVEVRFTWRCTEVWCVSDEVSPWYRVPVGQDWFQASICADGNNRWYVDSRVHYILPTNHTIEFWGQGEYNAAAGVTALIAKAIFDVSMNAGLRISGGTRMKVITASNTTSQYGRIAQSFGALAGPASC